MKHLKISESLSLPTSYVTKTCAVLAQRRKGKTYTASVIAEELVAAKLPFVALDPTGAWWGLRASADGQREGLPVVIFGGQHGDVPLERGSGAYVAGLVVEQPGYYVLDLSLFESNEAEREFATAFAEKLYRRKGQPNSDFALHLFVDEADRFVPQQSPAGDKRMLGAFEAIVRRGGLRGLGTTLISQRAAVVNKNVLEQLDILIALRTVGPNDRKAIDGYVQSHSGVFERNAMLSSISSLGLGEAWIWEPGAEPSLFERVQIRKRRTFNSSATPEPGEVRVEPRMLAKVDIDTISKAMAATIERAKADDPRALRARIAELERQVAAKPAPVAPKVESVEVPVLEPTQVERLRECCADMTRVAADLVERTRSIEASLARAQRAPTPRTSPPPRMLRQPGSLATIPPARGAAREPAPSGDLSGPEQRILDALAWLESLGQSEPELTAVAFLAGYKIGGGAFNNPRGRLRGRGLIDYRGDRLALTGEGRALARAPASALTSEEMQRRVMERLDGPMQRILQVAIDAYPKALAKDELAELSGYEPGGGAFNNPTGRLRTLGLIDYPERGMVVARPILFLEAS